MGVAIGFRYEKLRENFYQLMTMVGMSHQHIGRNHVDAGKSHVDAGRYWQALAGLTSEERGGAVGSWQQGYYYSHGRYIGNDDLAQVVAAFDAEDAERALARRDEARRAKQVELEASRRDRELARQVDQIVLRGLTAEGFWRPGRTWRKRLNVNALQVEQGQGQGRAMGAVEASHYLVETTESILLLHLKEWPEMRDQVRSSLQSLRSELAGPAPGPALRLAAESAAWAWANHWLVEMGSAVTDPVKVSRDMDRRRNWAQRRYNSALVTVERIRRLTRPRGPRTVIQVNNVVGNGVNNEKTGPTQMVEDANLEHRPCLTLDQLV